MKEVQITLKPTGYWLLGTETSGSNFMDSADYVPATMLRGLIGSRLHDPAHDPTSCTDATCLFCAIFRDQRVHFGNAYYKKGGLGVPLPLPLTARSCKRYPGFAKKGSERHGVHDLLLAELAWQLKSDPAFVAQARALVGISADADWAIQADRIDKLFECPTCAHGLKPLPNDQRIYQWRASRGIGAAELPPLARRTHVGINRARMVAEDGLLFTQGALDFTTEGGGVAFVAHASVPDELADALIAACDIAHGSIGRGRSRGYGNVRVEARLDKGDYPPVATRIATMQKKFTAALGEKPAGTLVTLTLRSAALLQAAGVPVRVPTVAQVGLPAGSVLLRGWAKTETVGGWDSAARMPRRTQQVVRAGSVFAYMVPESADLHAVCQKIEQNGMGDERGAGYGRVTVCADVHVKLARIA